jgi:cytoskeleton protein RodZ
MSTSPGSDEEHGPGGEDAIAIGARLRAARNRCNLQIEQVAQQLHLHPNIITAIEDGDQNALPEAIFVQGYLRSYARLVGLPAEEMVRRYCAQGPTPPPLSTVGPRRKTPLLPLPSARTMRNLILVLLLGILIWLAYPYVERLVTAHEGQSRVQQPGRLELPPAYEDPPRTASPGAPSR